VWGVLGVGFVLGGLGVGGGFGNPEKNDYWGEFRGTKKNLQANLSGKGFRKFAIGFQGETRLKGGKGNKLTKTKEIRGGGNPKKKKKKHTKTNTQTQKKTQNRQQTFIGGGKTKGNSKRPGGKNAKKNAEESRKSEEKIQT